MFEKLKANVNAARLTSIDVGTHYINHGYCLSWNPAEHKESDNGIERYSTPAAWDKYKAGEYTREKAVALAIRRMEREKNKYYDSLIDKLEYAAAAPDMDYAAIDVEWVRNTYWGNNPHAEVRTNTGYCTGRASGCGYDKESAAVCVALNGCPSIGKALYTAAENAIPEPDKIADPTAIHWGSLINYGAGYGPIPYFEGGVGMPSILGVFRAMGYTAENTASGRRYDRYDINRG